MSNLLTTQQWASFHANFRLAPLVALIAVLFSPTAYADSFTIENGEIVTIRQTLNDNETGSVETGGALNTSKTAIRALGLNNTVTNNGSISTSGDVAAGIASTMRNATLINNGSISTAGEDAYGIYSRGENATITNSGTILTTGARAPGIFSSAPSAIITNSGKIITTATSAYGIESAFTAAYTVITNSGSIATLGGQAHGIHASGANATITNSGSISTTGNSAVGIWSQGTNTILTNNGTITTAGTQSHGIFSDAATLTNNGTISTIGDGSHAIYTTSNTLNNSGNLSTTGANAHGIEATGISVTLAHSGSITVGGSGAIGIDVIGTVANTINLNGRVTASGSATQAIRGGGGDETLNLYPGARVIGTVDLGGGTNVVNVISNGAGPSATMTIANASTINQSGSGLSFVNGSTVAMVDTTNITASQASLGSLSSNIFQNINQQLGRTPSLHRPVKVAASEPVSGIWANDTQPVGWGHVFGKYTKHGSDGAALSFQDRTYGVIGGYEQRLGDHRAGVFGGFAHSNMDASASLASTGSNSAFAGVYGQYAWDQWRVNAALALGYANYNTDRTVTDNLYGVEKATADYHGWYLSPSVAITRIFDQGAGFSLRPSGELNYTYGRMDSYDESGTTRSNLSVGSRTAQVLNMRLQLAARQELADKKGSVEGRGGVSHTRYGDDDIAISLAGVGSARYGMTGTGNITGAYVGARGFMQWKKSLNLVGDVELFRSNNSVHSITAYLGLEYRF
ncbi:MAG: hypothetical protein H6R01_152 [Burkholderiaceae bacterium]|nr:hypothetical protein [Burkholderiaceae bacterium]